MGASCGLGICASGTVSESEAVVTAVTNKPTYIWIDSDTYLLVDDPRVRGFFFELKEPIRDITDANLSVAAFPGSKVTL